MSKIVETIKKVWSWLKPIVCTLETVEEKKAVKRLIELYGVSEEVFYTKPANKKRYKQVEGLTIDEYNTLKSVLKKLEECKDC